MPQIGGMYEGDRSRKQTLVDFGFRLPSAIDNRPLRFDEFLAKVPQLVFVSATPGAWELRHSTRVAEQLIRPTCLVDPEVELRPTKNQIDDLLGEIRKREELGERVLVTTLTKKMSEDLTDYLLEAGVKARYLHSEIDTLERIQIIRELRLGEYDVLVGVNLLREGLDLPEVSLVAILDADKEGFLRGQTSLIQTIGRAARNVNGRVLMYADKQTEAIKDALDETNRRRAIQLAYNEEHGITPMSITKGVSDIAEFLSLESPHVPGRAAAARRRSRACRARSSRSSSSRSRRRCSSRPRSCGSSTPRSCATRSRALRRDLVALASTAAPPRERVVLASRMAILLSALFPLTGALARFAFPGPDPMPVWLTLVIGLVGHDRSAAWIALRDRRHGNADLDLEHRRLPRRDRPRHRVPPVRAKAGDLGGRSAYRFPKRGVGVEQTIANGCRRRVSTPIRSARRSPPR